MASSFLDDLDSLLRDAGVDPETAEIPEGDLKNHNWMPVNRAVFSNDPHEWKCTRCDRTLIIKKRYPDPPPEIDENAYPNEDAYEKALEEYDTAIEAFENTKESLATMETIGQAMAREGIDQNCATEMMQYIHKI